MQKPIMIKRILVITLFLSCLVLPRNADARLTLGAVSEGAEGGVSAAQVETLAARIAEKLGDEVSVKWLDDTDSVLQWLERYAQLDLALLSAETVEKYRGRFLVVGPVSKDSSLNLVARQGVPGDVPGRLAGLVSMSGVSPWRGGEAVPSVEREIETVREEAPVRAAPETAPFPGGVEHVPPDRAGRAWQPEEAVPLPDIEPVAEFEKKKLVLGVVPDATGLVRTGAQAETLAGYLEATLPVDVTVREFTRLETFAEWFMRYRMVDIAVISPELAMLNLGRDYMPVAKLYRSDKPGAESAELVVMRRGGSEDLQGRIQQALLAMPETADGQQGMTKLRISDIYAPGFDRVEPAPAPVEIAPVVIPPAVPEAEVQVVLEDIDKAPELPEPVQPESPVSVAVPGPPVVADAVEPVPAPVPPAMPEPAALPETEIGDIALPDVMAPTQPRFPVAPDAVTLPVVPLAQPEVSAPPAVVAPQMPAVPEAPLPPAVEPPVPEPVTVVEIPSPVLPQGAAQEPEMPELPDLRPAEVKDVAPPVAVAAPPQSPVILPPVETPVPEPVAEPIVEIPSVVTDKPVEEMSVAEEKTIIEEILEFAEPISSHELIEKVIVLPEGDDVDLSEQDLVAVLGEDSVASMVAQPNIPQELRPSGIPVVRPGRAKPPTEVKEELLVASLPEPLKPVEPSKPPTLLPQPDPEPGVIYVIPFVSVMVPQEVRAGIFDQFVDLLNQQGDALGYQFLILKEGLQRVSPEWLAARKYVTGELYAYVEDRGATSTDLRSRARMIYHHPNQETPALSFEYPTRFFFNHDSSTLEIEQTKMANNIAETLSSQLIKALQN